MNKSDLIIINNCITILDELYVLDMKSRNKIIEKSKDLFSNDHIKNEFKIVDETIANIFKRNK